ncbi:hypothetical protein T05_8735 [Trichinella murrelli]|uniref:Uncharacterized protein n=1 Tax=Trichinella murrelli TaxID=144512 RepID=A0A0V0UGR5_9BILA|nr:hypothetical protein T05_8735 [Trichinella murrelli]
MIILLYYKNEVQQYLAKYAFIQRKTRFWKVPRQTNAYVSNKWPLKFPCAYLNTQGSCTTGTPLIRIRGGGIHSLCALLFNISLFWATRFSFIFGPFRIN